MPKNSIGGPVGLHLLLETQKFGLVRDLSQRTPASQTSPPGQVIRVNDYARFKWEVTTSAQIEELVELFWLAQVYRKKNRKKNDDNPSWDCSNFLHAAGLHAG